MTLQESHVKWLAHLMQSRRSVRQFTDRAVSREILSGLLEAAQWAPSNHNRQPWRFLIMQDRPTIQGLALAIHQAWDVKVETLPEGIRPYVQQLGDHAACFSGAPVLIVALQKQPIKATSLLLEDSVRGAQISGEPLSVAMAVQNMLLMAHALGLGACVLTAPLLVEEQVKATLDLPAGHDINSLVAVGYPAETPPPPRRKSLAQIAEYLDDLPQRAHHDI